MTIRTPSQRGTSNRRKGHQAERDLCRWLRVNGFAGAERAVRTGFRTLDRSSADPGDITGTGPIVWSVKDCAAEQITKWFAELDAMGDGSEDLRLLVHKRRGHANPGRWWCWLTLGDFSVLIDGHSYGPQPIRMELGDVVDLLRVWGYGDEPESGSQIASAAPGSSGPLRNYSPRPIGPQRRSQSPRTRHPEREDRPAMSLCAHGGAARCWPCTVDSCYDEPQLHVWWDQDDVDHAKNTGQDPPSGWCGCVFCGAPAVERAKAGPA